MKQYRSVILVLVIVLLVSGINYWGRSRFVGFENAHQLAILKPFIDPLGVSGCKISQRSYSGVERCYVQHEPSAAAISDELSKSGWRRTTHFSTEGELIGAWCKDDAIIGISKEEVDWKVEFIRAAAYKCEPE